MITRRQYRIRKRIKNFLMFYGTVCILFAASYTLSRYVETTSGIGGLDIAKFKVSVNDINVNDGVPIQFNFSESSTFVNKKVAPNSNGYFEFIINPEGTEVSLEYELKFGLEELDKDFELLYFTINDDTTHHNITEGNIVKGDLLLPTIEKGFINTDKKSIKVYWSWDEKEDITNPNIEDYDKKNINVIAVVKQKIK